MQSETGSLENGLFLFVNIKGFSRDSTLAMEKRGFPSSRILVRNI